MASTSLFTRSAQAAAVAEQARQQRGTWVRLDAYPTARGARAITSRITKGTSAEFNPPGDWETYTAPAEDGESVWLRYVAGPDPVPPLPETMTVRVRYDGEGPGYEGVGVLTVTIAARCPRCGGPRGADTIRPYRFAHDGAHFVVDQWTNPCQHVDVYAAVVAEAREPNRRNPVELIHVAYQRREIGADARQAADLLYRYGHDDAAAVLLGEIKNTPGLSTVQAAEFLRSLAGGDR